MFYLVLFSIGFDFGFCFGVYYILFDQNFFCFVRGSEKIQLLKLMGVDYVVDLGSENVIISVKEFVKIRKFKGVDVLYDFVGGKFIKDFMKVFNWGVQIFVIGFVSGEVFFIFVNIVFVKVNIMIVLQIEN